MCILLSVYDTNIYIYTYVIRVCKCVCTYTHIYMGNSARSLPPVGGEPRPTLHGQLAEYGERASYEPLSGLLRIQVLCRGLLGSI